MWMAIIRIAIGVIFIGLLERVATHAVPIIVLMFAVISIVLGGFRIRRGSLYYFDLLYIVAFLSAFVACAVSPDETVPWILRYRAPIMYLLLAIATMGPPLFSLPPFRFTWRRPPSRMPPIFVVLWGTSFLLSSSLLWLGYPIRTPLLIFVLLTIPTHITAMHQWKRVRSRVLEAARESMPSSLTP